MTGNEEIMERPEADVDGFLRHQRRVILLTAIEESKNGTLDAARNSAARSLEADWAAARQVCVLKQREQRFFNLLVC